MKCPPEGGGWGNGAGNANYTVYFSAQFSQADHALRRLVGRHPRRWPAEARGHRKPPATGTCGQRRGARRLPRNGRQAPGLLQRVRHHRRRAGLAEGRHFLCQHRRRRANLAHDIAGWDFDKVRARPGPCGPTPCRAWQSKAATTPARRSSPRPSIIRIIDPRAFPTSTASTPGPTARSTRRAASPIAPIFSGWDVFRSQYPDAHDRSSRRGQRHGQFA